MANPSLTDDQAREAVAAYREHGSQVAAARAKVDRAHGASQDTIQQFRNYNACQELGRTDQQHRCCVASGGASAAPAHADARFAGASDRRRDWQSLGGTTGATISVR